MFQKEPRLKILISAYSCEPNRGSEPEVGWQLGLHMAKYHNVTVVTRANNREVIEKALAERKGPIPEYIYYDLPAWVLRLKKKGLWVSIYYLFWQMGVRRFVKDRLGEFDVVHHATFNSFRQPGFWWFCPAAVVLGPLGGGQICPWRFLPWFRKQVFYEFMRSLSVVNSYIFPHIALSFYFCDKILVANEDTYLCIPWLFRGKIQRMLETAVTAEQFREREEKPPASQVEGDDRDRRTGIRFLWAGRLDKMKGGEFAIKAFAQALKQVPGATLTIAGAGPEERPLKRLIKSLDIKRSVIWSGKVPKTEMTEFMAGHDVFIFTSLRDTSGNVLLEAMAVGLPVITFCHQGAAEITSAETALPVPIKSHGETVAALSRSMVQMAESPEMRKNMGAAGRIRVRELYSWDRHAARMNEAYIDAFREHSVHVESQRRTVKVFFSFKGFALLLATGLAICGIIFYGFGRLQKNAEFLVNETLPSLSDAGAANASLTQSYTNLLLMIHASAPWEREKYRKQILNQSNQTAGHLNNYKASFFDKTDYDNYQRLIELRERYLVKRDKLISDVENGEQPPVIEGDLTALQPVYDEYRVAGVKLLDYTIQHGRRDGLEMVQVCARSRFALMVLGLGLFVGGFLFGFLR